jgi:hypothetical protein
MNKQINFHLSVVKTLTCVLAIVLSSLSLVAQSNNNYIQGKIIDNTRQPVPFASVALFDNSDHSLVKSAVAGEDGSFRLDYFKSGMYTIAVTAVGYKDYSGTPFEIKEASGIIIREDIVMDKNERTLTTVDIKGRKPLVDVRADKTVLNVAGTITAAGSTLFDMIRKAPGVRIGNGDEISINGKTGLLVYLDGNMVNLSGSDLNTFLRNFPSGSIEAIEVITNPSARYDAAGNAGIINIITKKNTNLGFNGTVAGTANYSKYKPKYNGGINLNYRAKGFNIFGSYDYFGGDYRNTETYLRKQDVEGKQATFDQVINGFNSNSGHVYKIGTDLYLSPKSTLGVLVDGSSVSHTEEVHTSTKIFTNPASLDSQLIASNRQPGDNWRMNYNANYRFRDTASGRELSLNANYGTFDIKSTSYQPNIYVDNNGKLLSERIYSTKTGTDIKVTSLNGDYSQNLWTGRLSLGGKYSDVRSENALEFKNFSNDSLALDSNRTSQFRYVEKLAAGYVDYNISIKRWNIQAGLRAEHTSSKGVLSAFSRKDVKAVDTQYLNFFPNVLVSYAPNDDQYFSIGYNKRIGRPAYQSLNPFEFVYDELSNIKGNPFLKPQFVNEFKLSHIFKHKLTSSFSYIYTRDKTLAYRDTLSGGRTTQTTINVDRQIVLNLNVSASLQPATWWEVFCNASIFRREMKGIAVENLMNVARNSWSFSATNTFTFLKKYKMELSGYYNAPTLDPPAIVRSMWSVDWGVQRTLFKDNGVLRLSVSDVFNSLKFRLDRDFGGLYYINTDKWETQILRLSFSYKFGNRNVKSPASRKTGVEDVQNRVN